MSATVRFPTGLWVRYNDCHFLSRSDRYTDLRVKDGGRLIAQAPTNGCLIEFDVPCDTGWTREWEIEREVRKRVDAKWSEVRRQRARAKRLAKARRKKAAKR